MRYYVAELAQRPCGFVLWTEKSGLRAEVVLELEQIAVDAQLQKQGIGTALILESLPQVASELASRGARLKHVLISTRADNAAQRLYRKTLGAEVEATLQSLYSADEVVMIARDPLRSNSRPYTDARGSAVPDPTRR
jgi:ribosomal protein S18 acetylase RimI-like enzyme